MVTSNFDPFKYPMIHMSLNIRIALVVDFFPVSRSRSETKGGLGRFPWVSNCFLVGKGFHCPRVSSTGLASQCRHQRCSLCHIGFSAVA